MTKKIILQTPETKKFIFYQCVDTYCEEIKTRIYTAKENSRLVIISKDVPKVFHPFILWLKK
jgi:hypothetical protein